MPGPAGPSPKLLGRIAALIMALVFGGIIWRAMSTNAAPSQPGSGSAGTEEVPDITELLSGAGESIVITLADQNDPGRVAGIIEVDRFDPIGNGERELINPRGWLYPRDGRVVRVRADRGVLAMPAANSTPESGTLEGDVQVSIYEGSDGPGIPPPDDAEPSVVASFEMPVRFETRYLRLSTPGAFRIESEQVTFDGLGLGVMLNNVRDRLELIDVDRGGRLEIRARTRSAAEPSTRAEAAIAKAADQPGETATIDAAAPAAAPTDGGARAQPKVDLYRAELRSAVVAEMGTSRMEGDRLELFARIRDNAIPDDAFAPIGFRRATPTGAASTDRPSPGDARADVGVTASSPPSDAPPGTNSESLVLVWDGPMSIRPLPDEATPTELESDDAAIAMFAEPDTPVRFADEPRGLSGHASRVRYAATRGVLSLLRGDDQAGVEVAETGSARFDRVDADLRTGTIRFSGAGSMVTEADASLEWRESGELRIGIDAEGDLTDRLTSAAFRGGVIAEQQEGAIESAALETRFGIDAQGRSALRSATITDGTIRANPDEFGRPRSLSGSVVRVDFGGDADALVPVRVEMLGEGARRARAEADGSVLIADRAVAVLARDASDELFVRKADASGSIVFTGENDTRAEGGAMRLDGVNERIRITGLGSAIAQGDSTIEGTDIHLDARSRRMDVEGSGRFTHTLRDDRGTETGRVLASWQRSMRFDDALGRLLCRGDVLLTAARDAYSRDKLAAERIEVEMTPRLAAQRLGQEERSAREVKIVRAFGGSTAGGDRPARAETQRYDRDNPEFAEGMLYIEGDQIIADAERSELRVPGEGTLLVLDRSGADAANAEAPGRSSIGPGLTRFTWAGSLLLDRAAGTGEMTDSVFVRHKSVGADAGASGAVSDLLCDRLTAQFSEDASNPGENGGQASLEAADAEGNVVFVSSGKRLEADGARFDAAREMLDALALPGRLVTLTEPGAATPVSARSIRWDLRLDQIEINRPSTVVLPSD
ncbi:MAG: hypothetical protein AAGA55_07550 [Planctomycetota bacterium]